MSTLIAERSSHFMAGSKNEVNRRLPATCLSLHHKFTRKSRAIALACHSWQDEHAVSYITTPGALRPRPCRQLVCWQLQSQQCGASCAIPAQHEAAACSLSRHRLFGGQPRVAEARRKALQQAHSQLEQVQQVAKLAAGNHQRLLERASW